MSPVPIPSAARAYGPARRVRVGALLVVLTLGLLPLGACGGGATPGGAWFMEPVEVLSLPMGASFPFRLAELPPKATVGLLLDSDGDLATPKDTYPLRGKFHASESGDAFGSVSTDGVPPGTHRLLAVNSSTGELLARADQRVILVARGRLTWFASASDEFVRFALPLPSGRVALAGQVTGATASGPASGPTVVPEDAFTAVLDGPNLVAVQHISGASEQGLTDLAVSPTGLFSVAGTAAFGLPIFGGPTSTPPVPIDADRSGFTATYDDDGDAATALLTWGFSLPGVPPQDVEATAVTHAADGARWLALRIDSNVYVGGEAVPPPGPAGGAVVVRLTNQNRAAAPFVTLVGVAEIHALRFDAQGHLFVAGTAEGPVRFGSAVPVDAFTGGAFVARYDTAGNCLGVLTRTTGTGSTTADDLALGADGSLYVVGRAHGVSTFGDVVLAPAIGGADGYVLALTSDLVPRWARRWTWSRDPANPDFVEVRCSGVVALAGGGCAVVGSTQDEADVGGVRIGDDLPNLGDGAVARYDADGELLWVLRLGGPDEQRVEGLAVDANGCLLIPGSSVGPLVLTDRDGIVTRPSVYPTSADGFLLTLDPDGRVR